MHVLMILPKLYPSHAPPELADPFCVPHNLIPAQLALAEDPIDERDGHLADSVS